MNSVDKKFVIGIAVIGSASYLYMNKKKDVKILGLDANNSKKFVGSMALISLGILAYQVIKGKKILA